MRAAFIIAAIFLSGPLLAFVGQAPEDNAPVLVVAPPWRDVADVAQAAGGQLIGPTVAPMAVLAISKEKKFGNRVRRAGGWFVLDGRALAALCGVSL